MRNSPLLRLGLTLVLGFPIAQGIQAQDNPGAARRVRENPAPVYPELARKLNLVGSVKLRVTVSADGAVKASEVVGGNPVLVKAAQEAVRKWKWVAAAQETREEVLLDFRPK